MDADAEVVVITGAGGMGLACARRLGGGRRLLLADVSEPLLAAAQAELGTSFDVHTQLVDVSSADSVAALAEECRRLGRLRTVVHTAGLSPTMASVERILAVDLLGTVHILDAFLEIACPGTVAVIIASMSGALMPVDPEVEKLLATAPAAELPLTVEATGIEHPGAAYAFAKRGNQVRVKAAAAIWGQRGARVVSISPGVIATGMGLQELAGEETGVMQHMVDTTPLARMGHAEDIAAAVDWLASSSASFVTGIDLLVDGGVVASLAYPA
jgi:NAD(P)-dependent dehydrogenase (short-subunit alcohol dehydrogenase family)